MPPGVPPGMRPGMAPGPAAGLPPLPPLPPSRLEPSRPGAGSPPSRPAPAPWTWLAAVTALAGGAGMFLLERRRRSLADLPPPD